MLTLQIGCHSADLLAAMNAEGMKVTRRQLLYAVEMGRIPRPFTTRSGDYSWPPEEVGEVIDYFSSPRPMGRPRTRAS